MTELCLDEVLDVDMGRYTGIVWVIIVNNHHTQEFLSQLTLVIKKIPGSDWGRIRDFCTKKEAPVLEVSPFKIWKLMEHVVIHLLHLLLLIQ